tara:strand:- start:157 stop:507 length:351 start_codon:yes stop_codon:yes gene_type:complete
MFPTAGNKDSKGEDDDGKKSLLDWDGAWRQIKREIKGTGTLNPDDLVDRSANSSMRQNSGRTAKEDIQDDENRVADIWSSEIFTKAGIVSVLLLLFFFVFVIGPPPSDGRCSLPWC